MSVDKYTFINEKDTREYDLVPRDIPRYDMDLAALGLWVYLYSKPSNWEFHPEIVQKERHIGRHTWLKLSKILRDCGLLQYEKSGSGTTIIVRNVLRESENQTITKNQRLSRDIPESPNFRLSGISDPLENKERARDKRRGETSVPPVPAGCNPDLYDKNGNYIRKKHRAKASAPAPDPVPEAHTLDDHQDTPHHYVQESTGGKPVHPGTRSRGLRRVRRDRVTPETLLAKAVALGFPEDVWREESVKVWQRYKSTGFKQNGSKITWWDAILTKWEEVRLRIESRNPKRVDDYGQVVEARTTDDYGQQLEPHEINAYNRRAYV